MKKYEFKTQGTCSQRIVFEMDGETIGNVEFIGGCNGNLKGIGALVKGKKASEVIGLLSGIRCGMKQTSCPDQLARALEQALKEG